MPKIICPNGWAHNEKVAVYAITLPIILSGVNCWIIESAKTENTQAEICIMANDRSNIT